MSPKQKIGCAISIISLFVTSPIWYYLLYQILRAINASDVMWLLFWIYIPVGILLGILKAIFESAFDEK